MVKIKDGIHVDARNAVKSEDASMWMRGNAVKSEDASMWMHGNAVKSEDASMWMHGNAVKSEDASMWMHGNAIKSEDGIHVDARNTVKISPCIHMDAWWKERSDLVMEKALAYVCCPADAGKAKVQKYCRKIYELGYVPICPQFSFAPFLDEGEAEDMQAFQRMSHMLLRRCRMVVVCGKEMTGTMNTEISMADRFHIICTTLDGLVKIKEAG